MCHEEGLCNEEEEEEDQETHVKLSATPVIKRDTLVAIACSIRGTNRTVGIHGLNEAKDEKRWWTTEVRWGTNQT